MPIFKDLGTCKECGRHLMLRKGVCAACWRKKEKIEEIENGNKKV